MIAVQELLALQARMGGSVNRGVSEDKLSELPTQTFTKPGSSAASADASGGRGYAGAPVLGGAGGRDASGDGGGGGRGGSASGTIAAAHDEDDKTTCACAAVRRNWRHVVMCVGCRPCVLE